MFFKKRRVIDSETTTQLDKTRIPNHIAIIMDGNGRWAKRQNLPRVAGHQRGMEVVKDLSLIHISEPTRRTPISYAVFCLKKKKK